MALPQSERRTRPYLRLSRGRRMRSRPYHSIQTRQGLIDELDRVTSFIVRKRDGRCVTCGETRPDYLTCSHFYKRKWLAVRFNLMNCNCQCEICNEAHNSKPWGYTRYFIDTYGTDAMSELFELRNKGKIPTNADLRKMLDNYRCMLRGMG